MKLTFLTAIVIGVIALHPSKAAAQCATCQTVSFGFHKNVNSPYAFWGNIDLPHSEFFYTCEFMMGSGVHLESVCIPPFFSSILRDLDGLETLSGVEISSMVASARGYLFFNEAREVLQQKACDDSGAIVAQYSLTSGQVESLREQMRLARTATTT